MVQHTKEEDGQGCHTVDSDEQRSFLELIGDTMSLEKAGTLGRHTLSSTKVLQIYGLV